MANLIITKNCNLNCDYCFAGVNYSGQKLEMAFALYILYLKHLQISGEKQIRLIGGEPLLHSQVQQMLLLGIKSGFNIIIFSNLTLPVSRIEKIFFGLGKNITVNINVNKKSFYKPFELANLYKNIETLNKNNIKIKISYLVYNQLEDVDFIIYLATTYNIKEIHLKPYNYNGMTHFETGTTAYGNMFYDIITQHGKKFQFFISCGFSKDILSSEQIRELQDEYNIDFKFGCAANGGKYDIDYDGGIFRCFSLEGHFNTKHLNLHSLYRHTDKQIAAFLHALKDNRKNQGICLGYQI